MLFPIAQTNPTELVATLTAGHVVTTLVLLNRIITLRVRATLSVCHYPDEIFTLIVAFNGPLSQLLTAAGIMCLLTTIETEADATVTLHCADR